jgi:hypothetical protein
MNDDEHLGAISVDLAPHFTRRSVPEGVRETFFNDFDDGRCECLVNSIADVDGDLHQAAPRSDDHIQLFVQSPRCGFIVDEKVTAQFLDEERRVGEFGALQKRRLTHEPGCGQQT